MPPAFRELGGFCHFAANKRLRRCVGRCSDRGDASGAPTVSAERRRRGSLNLPLYRPKPEVLDGLWTPPAKARRLTRLQRHISVEAGAKAHSGP
jgi:hypothetical protein